MATDPRSKLHVFLIDSDSGLLNTIAAALTKKGFLSTMFLEKEDAFSASDRNQPSLVIVNFATVDGDIGAIRKKWPTARVICVAGTEVGRDLHEVSLEARRQGATKFVKRSVEAGKLAELVELMLSGRASRPVAMVVEDSKTYRAMLAAILEEEGFLVSSKETMEEALSSATLIATDLVISDIFMPGEGGISGIQKVRDEWPGTCIMAISGGWDGASIDQTLAAAKKIGADAVMQKPIAPEALIATARELLGPDAMKG